MMHFKYYLLSAFIGILLGIGGCLLYQQRTKKPVVEPTVQLDSLNRVIDSLQLTLDNYQAKVDTVYLEKWKIKYVYDEKANDIVNQSADADWNYYTNFLRARFPSDSSAVETN
jgi:hypothetical protein